MGLLLEAARAWDGLREVSYILDVGRKGKLTRIELFFFADKFPHLAGMQYAGDVDFGIREAEYYGERLIAALLDGRMDDRKIEGSRNWTQIAGRLKSIVYLQQTLDNDFEIVAFNPRKVRGYCRIQAKFAIRSMISDEIYFVFLDEESGRYYCKSTFQNDDVNYIENQSPMTLLQKTKVTNDVSSVLFTRERYQPK